MGGLLDHSRNKKKCAKKEDTKQSDIHNNFYFDTIQKYFLMLWQNMYTYFLWKKIQ